MTTTASRQRRLEYISVHARATAFSVQAVVVALQEVLGAEMLATIVDRNVRTVARWVNGKVTPALAEERCLRDIFHITELVRTIEPDETVRAWFMGMNPLLADDAPVDAIRDGRGKQVMTAARVFIQHAQDASPAEPAVFDTVDVITLREGETP